MNRKLSIWAILAIALATVAACDVEGHNSIVNQLQTPWDDCPGPGCPSSSALSGASPDGIGAVGGLSAGSISGVAISAIVIGVVIGGDGSSSTTTTPGT